MRSLEKLLTGVALLAATVAATEPPALVVVRGYEGQVYEARWSAAPAPAATVDPKSICGLTYDVPPHIDPRATPAPFADGMRFALAATPCGAAAVAATKSGLEIEYVLGARGTAYAASTPVDNLDFGPDEDVVQIDVCVRPCDPPNRTLRYRINANPNVFAAYASRPKRAAPWLSGGIAALATAVPSTTPLPGTTPAPGPMFGGLLLPWNVLDLPVKESTSQIEVSVSLRKGVPGPGPTPTPATAQLLGSIIFPVTVRPAFDGLQPSHALQYADDDRRQAAITQYGQYVPQLSTAPSSLRLAFGTAPPFTVTMSPAPAPLTKPYPPLTGDLNAPLGRSALLAATFSQNRALVQGIQKAIAGAVSAASPAPSTSPFPNVPCATCVTFQSTNSSSFDVPAGSTRLSIVPSNAGSDDSPFALSKLSDLVAGGLLSFGIGPQNTTLSLLHAQQATPVPIPAVNLDDAVGLTRNAGQANFVALASYVNHSIALPAPGATPAPPGHIALSHLATFAFGVTDDNVTSNALNRTVADASSFLRVAYDATDRGLNAFGGMQWTRTKIIGAASGSTPGQDQLTEKLMLGYRHTDVRYQQLDGTQIALPTVRGPIGAAEIVYAPAAPHWVGYDVKISGNDYHSASDVALWGDAKFALTDKVGVTTVGLYYEYDTGRQSAPLAAVTQLGTTLGDNPFTAAVNELPPGLRSRIFPFRDHTVGVSIAPPSAKNELTPYVSAGMVFGHLAPACTEISLPTPAPAGTATPLVSRPLIACEPGAPTRTVTASGGLIYKNLALFGSLAPTFYEQSRSANASKRVYNALLTYKFNSCDGIVVTATNDAEVLTPFSYQSVNNTLQAELDVQRHFDLLPPALNAPTLFVGFSNSFGVGAATYSGAVAPGAPISSFLVTYPTHTYTLYTGLRLGNRAFRSSLAPDSFCAPVPKERTGEFTRP